MKKRTIIIITIISSILSLIMIFLSYFGITRYITLKFMNTESYISNYHKLTKTKPKTIISISTKPDRITHIKSVLNSILDQTIRVDNIFLIIPQTDIDNNYKLPDNLKNAATLFPTGKDYGEGCCNSVIHMLLYEKECDSVIISLMDNIIYGKDFIETMMTKAEQNPGKTLIDSKHTSMLVKPEYYDCSIINRDKDKYNDEWFLKNSIVVNYNENYKS